MPYVGIGVRSPSGTKYLLGPKMVMAYIAITFALFSALALLAIGHKHAFDPYPFPRVQTLRDVQEITSVLLMEEINAENIKANLRLFTKEPHQAGTKANEKVAQSIKKLYEDAGLSKVHTTTYEVLLSYPDWKNPNHVRIKNSAGANVFVSKGISPPLVPDEQGAPDAGHQWLAWSAAGVVEGDVVYCHHGNHKDFENVKKMGIDVKGKIAMMRYGEGFRGDKVAAAQKAGAIGAILFSDPDEVARDGLDKVYPSAIWMPHDGVQRGSLLHTNGDPLSPLYPSKPGAYKSKTIEEAKAEGLIPSIPAIPVSYTTAYQILSRMQGRPVPVAWQGAVNVTYRMGPGFLSGEKVVVDVKGTLETRKIHNVIGYLPGVDEEDRYVILGNHFDAWVYGSIDPNSGTAILAEVARAMVNISRTTNWKPARTLMFAAWDAEEYGLIGSAEFVEEFVQELQRRAVVYLNMDCFQGNSSLHVATVPTLFDVVVEAAKKVPNPLESEVKRGRKTLYDTWRKTFPGAAGSPLPSMPVPGGGSDHSTFLTFAGIPVVDFNFKNTTTRDTYPLYHTLYETPFVNEHLYDTNNFAVHRAIGQMWGEMARAFADAPVLPLNASRLASEMSLNYVPDLRRAVESLPPAQELSAARSALSLLETAVTQFVRASAKFAVVEARAVENIEKNPFDLRLLNGVNERLMMVDRCFVNPRGQPGRPEQRNLLYSISDKNNYESRVMSTIFDSIDDFKSSSTSARKASGRVIAEEITIVFHAVNCATSSLRHFI